MKSAAADDVAGGAEVVVEGRVEVAGVDVGSRRLRAILLRRVRQ